MEKFKLYIKQYYRIVGSVRNTESKNPKVARTGNGRLMLLSNCTMCDSKQSKFIKKQETS